MGVDYIIKGECKVRNNIVENELVETQKLATMVITLRSTIGNQMKDADFNKISFDRMVITPSGQEQRQYTVESAMKEVRKLEKYEKYCQKCKYNIREQGRGQESPFGCIGSIAYPISTTAEEALLHTINVIMVNDEYRQKYGLILKYIKDHPTVGNRIRAMRESPNGSSFFQYAECPSVNHNGEIITSDQVLEVLIGYDITPDYARAIHYPFFNVFYNVFTKSKRSEEYKADSTTRQFWIYGNGFAISARENIPIQVRI